MNTNVLFITTTSQDFFPHYSYYLNCLHTSLLLKPNEHICKLKMFDWANKMFTSQTASEWHVLGWIIQLPLPALKIFHECFWSPSIRLHISGTCQKEWELISSPNLKHTFLSKHHLCLSKYIHTAFFHLTRPLGIKKANWMEAICFMKLNLFIY